MAATEGEHPLENEWVFWEHRKSNSGRDYGNKMHQLGEFRSVEGFWQFKNNLPKPSEVFFTPQTGQKKFEDREVDGFSMFKKGIRPEWEDEKNMHGGEFFCRQVMSENQLDDAWERLLCGVVGETIDDADYVCGVRVVDKSKGGRPTYRLEIWFSTQDKRVLEGLQSRLIKCLKSNLLKEYMEHSTAVSHHGGAGGGGGKRAGSGRGFK